MTPKYKQKKMEVQVTVETVPNGYALTIGPKEFMYFTPLELMEGIFVHVGLSKNDYMDKETIKDLMTAAATWPNAEDAVKEAATLTAEKERLTRELGAAKHRIGILTEKLDNLQDQLDELAPKASKKGSPPVKRSTYIPKGVAESKQTKPVNTLEKQKNIPKSLLTPKTADEMKKHKELLNVAFNEKVYKNLMMPISKTGLPTRVLSVLTLVGGQKNKTVGDAIQHDKQTFLKMRGCGKFVMETLEAWLVGHHLELGMNVREVIAIHDNAIAP